jgi:hypothetical protein
MMTNRNLLVPAKSWDAVLMRSTGPSDLSFASLNCPNKEAYDGRLSSLSQIFSSSS